MGPRGATPRNNNTLNACMPIQAPEVGQYLPPAGIDDLVLFVPDAKKTPAIRAGTVDPSSPYRFALPPSFRCVSGWRVLLAVLGGTARAQQATAAGQHALCCGALGG
jgi:hypothetical protein